ncbi:sigma-70 family RNA polymerase sigma factor [Phragmitibacter flavus]|uniref:Sigma-70 family RNA polymerase sigma factor n=1 Tax=Phragmitibacter flavus TaxID=2576071 RepID=A0A5R8KG37_9BACT|nr:sigma-70 family RNA polymerase sigma factor [Phragmitibacter flavus]TLD71268.1 sigma-70 family RNA polymerase sigma factor [Phragmitibacter flavus]
MSEAAPPEHYETFVRLFVSHEGRLRGFVRSLLNNWDSVDEVMQETSLVAWRKFAQFDPDTNFMAWAAAIARFESLKHLRRQSRDKLVFNDDILDLLAEESLEDTEHLEHQRAALSTCLAKLDTRQKDLLQLAYQPGVKFHEVAAQAGKSTQAFYKTIQRLRASLLNCAERQLKQSGASA